MRLKLASSFALRNLAANKFLEIPFVLSSGTMLIIFNIMASLLQNDYVNTRHSSLPMIISFGIVITAIFSFVFIVYANHFLIRRNKEFALYGILGLEKKHIKRIIFIEQLVQFSLILILGIVGGYFFGKLSFLWLNHLMNDEVGGLMHYPFSLTAAKYALVFVVLNFIAIYLVNTSRLRSLTPIELLSSAKKAEKEPKVRRFLLLMGLGLLASGYYIALTTEGTLKSLGMFFIAALLVIIASYLLFTTLSIALLKMQKRRPGFYRDKRFLSISGMLYRMKSNAVSLASIAVFSTAVIIAISTTWTIYDNINAAAEGMMDRMYSLESLESVSSEEREEFNAELMRIAEASTAGGSVEDAYILNYGLLGGVKVGDEILPFEEENFGKGKHLYMIMYEVADYNKKTGNDVVLAEDEVLLSTNSSELETETIVIEGKNYRARMIENIVPTNMAIDSYVVVVPNFSIIESASKHYFTLDIETRKPVPAPISSSLFWNVSGSSEEDVTKLVEEHMDKDRTRFLHFDEIRSNAFSMDGGILFLGVMIGILFLTGAVLIIYYKQISEGGEDREKYQIMKKVGLPDKLIKKTSEMQIVWLFFLPLAVATLHSLVASKIVYQLLGLFGVRAYADYGSHLAYVVLAFAVIYFIIFKITSNVYYRIVK